MGTGKNETTDIATNPDVQAVTGATARHEVIEAMRWARSLLAQGIEASDIAFTAASPGEYDDLVLAMSTEASLPIHFAHGRRALATRDGQAAAALADVVLHGLSQDRVRRLATLAHAAETPFGRLPDGWMRELPSAAPLGSPERWPRSTCLPGARKPPWKRERCFCAVPLSRYGDVPCCAHPRQRWKAALVPCACPRPWRLPLQSAGCRLPPWPAAPGPMRGCLA